MEHQEEKLFNQGGAKPVQAIARDLALQLINGEMEVLHFLCRTHSERTLNRKLAGPACKNAKKHLYDALYCRKKEIGCDNSLKKALKLAPMGKRQYIEREWVLTKQK